MNSGHARFPALAVALVLVSGCARVGPPPGGPSDNTPPVIVLTVPENAATGVGRYGEIRIEFSEEMNRRSVERGFSIEPDVELRNLRWDGAALVVTPVAELPDSTTFVVGLAESAEDYHGVAMETPLVLTFSTGLTLHTGVISGAVTLMGDGVAGATVWACRPPVTSDDGIIRVCRYATLTASDGTFRFVGVAASERPYVLLAFVDKDGDNVYTVHEETGRLADAAAIIDGPDAVAPGIQIELTDGLDEGMPAITREKEELWNSQK